MKKTLLLILLFLTFACSVNAQLTAHERRMLKNANSYFENEEFGKALPIYLKIDSLIDDNIIKYRIGACYLNTDYDRLKALPYLEEVSKVEGMGIPIVVYSDLGTLYHFTYRFEMAIKSFKQYIELAQNSELAKPENIEYAKRMIQICQNALEITTRPFKGEIEIMGAPINSMESEFCPMISADEQVMVYMRTVGLGSNRAPATRILISHKNVNDFWDEPRVLNIDNNEDFPGYQPTLAGLSPDGKTIFLNMGEGLNQDIYSGMISNFKITNIEPLNKEINTPFYEGRVSVSSDGTTLYFVSDRPGGFGGTDIYRARLNRRGSWDDVENLGNAINTSYNENSPFLHPDNQTLFFSSEGHKTIGGNDIFSSKFEDKTWSVPENLGFLNSTKDDLFFVLNANGQVGYFSTSKNNIYDKHNIFKVNFKDPIPLTLVKGTIKAGNPPKPIDADIQVYDKQSGLKVKYVYNPDSITGKYLMIFPPAKNYDIIVSAKNYLPQLINVYIPYQTYFYELFQEIVLHPINVDNKMVGERVTVNNMFYDIYKTTEADSVLLEDLPKQPKYYDHLLELVENIIQTTDSLKIIYREDETFKQKEDKKLDNLLNLIGEAIETTDPVTLSILDANARQKDKINQTHFYTEGDKEKSSQMQIIGSDTVYTAPPVISESAAQPLKIKTVQPKQDDERDNFQFRMSKKEDRKYIHHFTLYYDVNEFNIKPEYNQTLEQIVRLLIDNPTLGAEIFGYTDSKGEKEFNLSLSRQRAQEVLKLFIDKGIDQKKIIAKGYGEAVANSEEKENQEYFRKVDINIFQVIKK